MKKSVSDPPGLYTRPLSRTDHVWPSLLVFFSDAHHSNDTIPLITYVHSRRNRENIRKVLLRAGQRQLFLLTMIPVGVR